MFEYVFTDDGITPPKPDSACVDKYCSLTGADKSKIVMVGDTVTDIRFARNGGIFAICVGNEKNLKKLEKLADVALPDISCVWQAIEGL